MEDNTNRVYVNLSGRKFEPKKYDITSKTAYSYKPDTGYWGALPSEMYGYFSEWDEEYGLDIGSGRNDDEDIYITSFKLDPKKTYTLHPMEEEVLLQGFENFLVKHPNLTTSKKRRLLAELVKNKKGLPDVEHIICQIDLDEDIAMMEKIFGGFKGDGTDSAEVFKNLGYNIRRAFVENFAGVEVTKYALGQDSHSMGDDILSYQYYIHQKFPDYEMQVGFWDMHSITIFDTDAINIIDEKIIPSREVDRIEEERENKGEQEIK